MMLPAQDPTAAPLLIPPPPQACPLLLQSCPSFRTHLSTTCPQNLSSPVPDVGAEGGLSAGLRHSLDLIFPEAPLSARAVRTHIWPWCVRRGDHSVILCLNPEELMGS